MAEEKYHVLSLESGEEKSFFGFSSGEEDISCEVSKKGKAPKDPICPRFSGQYSTSVVEDDLDWLLLKKLTERSRVCHNHEPQPTLDTKRKRKRTKTYTRKTNKQMYEKHKDKLPLPQAR